MDHMLWLQNQDGTGPQDPQVIIADGICQGIYLCYIQCKHSLRLFVRPCCCVCALLLGSRMAPHYRPIGKLIFESVSLYLDLVCQGTRPLFKHLGRVEDLDLAQYELNDAKSKTGQGATFAAGGSKRTGSLGYFKAGNSPNSRD